MNLKNHCLKRAVVFFNRPYLGFYQGSIYSGGNLAVFTSYAYDYEAVSSNADRLSTA
ncbi:hypothetical protein GCM10010912_46890 [Paenibacillus albidus]|uniref:Uncharacterized protein n=1 Tax=Paenibacillus albidus TaxID=2041023 RepID=A0A917CSS7_9BACL|nr:hypothetical protein GCM10010912_46890 [Paenibacillus albidus]